LPRLGLVVLDEAQFISDPQRGIVVELILTHLRNARERVSPRSCSRYRRPSEPSITSMSGSG
jgi:replicative superfamily II helicase